MQIKGNKIMAATNNRELEIELQRKEIEEFKRDPITHIKKYYLAQNGCMQLDRHKVPIADADSDNWPVWFAAVVQRLVDKGYDVSPLREHAISAIESCFVYDKNGDRIKGLYHRKQSAGADSANPHDNYNGICSLSLRFDLPYAREICDKGRETHWVLDNQNPDNPNISRIKVPSETGYYMMCAGFKPTAVEALWYAGATIITLGYAIAPRSSCHQLSYIRTKNIELSWEKHGKPRKYWLWIYSSCNATWTISVAIRGGLDKVFDTYYNWTKHSRPDKTHPTRMCSELSILP